MYGELVPIGGGDTIPLLKNTLLVGRRENCDIVLRFSNVSGQHCQLSLDDGYWFVQDLNSQNGVKVNGVRVMTRKRLDPGDKLSVAKHQYELIYSPAELGASATPPADDNDFNAIMGQSLLDRAGLKRRAEPNASNRFDATNDAAGQLKKKTYE
jgi:adenylate cyclase